MKHFSRLWEERNHWLPKSCLLFREENSEKQILFIQWVPVRGLGSLEMARSNLVLYFSPSFWGLWAIYRDGEIWSPFFKKKKTNSFSEAKNKQNKILPRGKNLRFLPIPGGQWALGASGPVTGLPPALEEQRASPRPVAAAGGSPQTEDWQLLTENPLRKREGARPAGWSWGGGEETGLRTPGLGSERFCLSSAGSFLRLASSTEWTKGDSTVCFSTGGQKYTEKDAAATARSIRHVF